MATPSKQPKPVPKGKVNTAKVNKATGFTTGRTLAKATKSNPVTTGRRQTKAPEKDPWSLGHLAGVGDFLRKIDIATGKTRTHISDAMDNPTPVIPYTVKNIKAIKRAQGK